MSDASKCGNNYIKTLWLKYNLNIIFLIVEIHKNKFVGGKNYSMKISKSIFFFKNPINWISSNQNRG